MRTKQTIAALLSGCAALLLAGCAGGGEVASVGSADAPAVAAEQAPVRQTRAPAGGDGQARDEAGRAGGEAGRDPASGVEVTRQDREVIYTGRMTVRVKDVAVAAQQAKDIVTGAGGHLAKEETRSSEHANASAELEFKIPPARYPDVLTRLGGDLGERLSLNQQTEDVTLMVADVESRVKSAERSLESLRTLLTKADTIGQVLDVEREIAAREANLESLQAQRKSLAEQTAMATLTLRLAGPAAAVTTPSDEPAGFFGGLRAGWESLVTFLMVLVTALGAALPWLVMITPPVVLAAVLLRRRRRRTAPPASGPPAPDPSTA
ncbi:DUF4349 domain-containing protein [Nonomuraea sp. MCN248]|uniref:DUF4349 domain-containing protein n=1 Tax=Nonomuraea corallina TaxID=2989783 RepID=A0ABT4SAK9_9ACTN|nr:DUF4349 domain-containing protein [Nonomuraea corallina]MDA0634244.1 DUF4349 domain-containing protein [Nonomuraea corallina]